MCTLQVAAFGKTTLGLTYSLVLGEAVLSPAIPSVAARAGGIFFPLAKVRVGLTKALLKSSSSFCCYRAEGVDIFGPVQTHQQGSVSLDFTDKGSSA